jgi:hypothetical protein
VTRRTRPKSGRSPTGNAYGRTGILSRDESVRSDRQYLAWLADADLDKDPLASAEHRDWAVRDYRTHLQAVFKRSPATVNTALAAVDDLYIRNGLGPASAARVEIAPAAPRALDHRAQLRYLRAVQTCPPAPLLPRVAVAGARASGFPE